MYRGVTWRSYTRLRLWVTDLEIIFIISIVFVFIFPKSCSLTSSCASRLRKKIIYTATKLHFTQVLTLPRVQDHHLVKILSNNNPQPHTTTGVNFTNTIPGRSSQRTEH